MGAFSVWHWIVLLLILAVPLSMLGAARSGPLVIKDWKADTKPVDEFGNFVNIVGRRSGVIAWLLSLLKIDPTTTIRVGRERVEFSTASLAGIESRMLPLQSVCSTYYGYYKPWKAAASIVALFVFIGLSAGASAAENGSQGTAFLTLVVSSGIGLLIAVVYYLLNRTLTLGFVEHSGVVLGIRFKRSVIENVDINQDQAKSVCVIIQKLVEYKERSMVRSPAQ